MPISFLSRPPTGPAGHEAVEQDPGCLGKGEVAELRRRHGEPLLIGGCVLPAFWTHWFPVVNYQQFLLRCLTRRRRKAADRFSCRAWNWFSCGAC